MTAEDKEAAMSEAVEVMVQATSPIPGVGAQWHRTIMDMALRALLSPIEST